MAFTVNIPDDLAPGEYAASVVAQRAEKEDDRQSGPMGVRFIPPLRGDGAGDGPGLGAADLEPHLEITDLRAATNLRQQTVIGELSNTGNDGLNRAEGHLTVRQTDGVLLQEIPVRLGYFLAGDDLDYRIGLEPALAAGEYDVTLALTYQVGTVELTRRLVLEQLPELPVVRDDAATDSSPQPAGLPRWVLMAIGAAGISIALLMALLAVQSRRLAQARSTTVARIT